MAFVALTYGPHHRAATPQQHRSRRRFNSNTVVRPGSHERTPQVATAAQPKYVIPEAVLDTISVMNSRWAEYAVAHTLREPNLDAQIVLLGVANFAPLQQQAVQEVLQQVQPQAVALEMPEALPGLKQQSSVVLPYPYVVQLLVDALDEWHSGVVDPGSASASTLIQELSDPELRYQAKLGRDVMDPFEALGFYPAIDLLLRPEQAAQVLQLFGYLPGQEQGHAVAAALSAEAQVMCADASIRMQEAWVGAMMRSWSLQESDLGRQLHKELAAVQQLVPAAHVAWDEQLAGEVMLRTSGMSSNTSHSDVAAAAQLEALLAFKVCRACAAAMLPPGPDAAAAVAAQARLQPLKFMHFEKRALHMAEQLRELCRWRAAHSALVRLPGPADSATPSTTDSAASVTQDAEPQATSAQPPTQALQTDPTATDGTAGKPFTLLAVVGRQYVPMIQQLWSDPNSALWRGEVPRTFAPSTVEPIRRPAGEIDPDTASGGSRPVGQKALRLGQ